ncbi:MAG: hypothetical protein HQK65_01820 [Desulfamplus sp.]|nr:hypothetical protein [Desulfamplus sp.]
MNSTKPIRNDGSLLCEFENQGVYASACELFNAGFHITSLHKYKKYPFDDFNKNTRSPPEVGMTGVGIVTGTLCNSINKYVFALDIDIYRSERRDKILSQILEQIGKEVYLEKTPSGGYRIIFYMENLTEKNSKQFPFAEENDNAEHKDNVEFFAKKKQVVVAPSKAKNKSNEIGEYKPISNVGLMESATLTEYELEEFLKLLEMLSDEYSSKKFQHKHTISPEKREKIRHLHHQLKSEGYITGPLYNGEKHCTIPDWKKGVDNAAFDKENLTGIVLKLGKQKDGSYLNCFDIDIKEHKLGELPMHVLGQFKPVLGELFYAERSVSGGYHIIFKTKKPLDLDKKWKLSTGKTLEVLWADHETINLAPTSSYINKYQFSGFPEYGYSSVLSDSDIRNITTVDTDTVRNFVNNLESCRKNGSFNGGKCTLNSSENKAVRQYMKQYGSLSEINKQIKTVFPDVIDLLDYLEINHSNNLKPLYINFFSLCADDGKNPDALLYYNNNQNSKNTWTGYSVQDFHAHGEVMSFGQYLCKYDQKHDQKLFDNLMERIGYGKLNKFVPITTTFWKGPIVYKCGQYISDDIMMQIIKLINQVIQHNHNTGKQTKILITAPTGVGKTEMFYRLAAEKEIRMILALSYTSQVLQGKESHTTPGILKGMCNMDYEVPDTGSIFMTYNKAPIVEGKINPSEYVMVIDEAHNLVNHSDFRRNAIHDLQHLSDNCKAVIYITATPEYINHKDLDLEIKIEQENLPLKKAYVCKYNRRAIPKVVDALISQHIPGTIDVVYVRSKKQMKLMKKLIQAKLSTEVHILYSDIKEDSKVYDNLSKYERLSGKSIFKEGGVLLTTNLIVDGVNILDYNIGNVFLVNIKSTTDLIQFPSRFRNGFNNYFLFVSGNIADYVEKKNRQKLTEKYYNLAYHQKQSFDVFFYNMKQFQRSTGVEAKGISLSNRFTLLDNNGEISENAILRQVQDVEARRMNYDTSEIQAYMNEYNFDVSELSINNITTNCLTVENIENATIAVTLKKIRETDQIRCILTDNKYAVNRGLLVKDYLKGHKDLFDKLLVDYQIDKHKPSGMFKELLQCKDCQTLLYKYCTGLELNAVDPLALLQRRYSRENIYSMKRTYQNLVIEMSGVMPPLDDRFWRFYELREFIRKVKNQSDEPVIINSSQLLHYAKFFNSKYSAVYNEKDSKNVVGDLKDIFHVEVDKIKRDKSNRKVTEYIIHEEWTLQNIQRLSFRSSNIYQ